MSVSPPRAFLHPRALGLVALGGALGAAAREGLVLSMPGPLPWAILVANIAGAFVLGLLFEGLAGSGMVSGRSRRLRLLLGTGFCGGFTTYSTLAVGTAALAGWGGTTPAHGLGWAGAYAVGTVVVGALATWCGILAGSWRSRAGNRLAAPAGSSGTGPGNMGGTL